MTSDRSGVPYMLIGLVSALLVYWLWVPFLNASEHLVTLGFTLTVRPRRLESDDKALILGLLVIYGVISGLVSRGSYKRLGWATLAETLFPFPWPFFALWALLLAPDYSESYRPIEALCWATMPIILNLLIACLSWGFGRVKSTRATAKMRGTGA